MFQGPALLTFAPQVIAQVELRPVIVRLEQCRPLQPGNGVLGPPVQVADQCPLEACTSRGLPRGRGVRRWVGITAEDRLAALAKRSPGFDRRGEGDRGVADGGRAANLGGVDGLLPVQRHHHPEKEQLVGFADQGLAPCAVEQRELRPSDPVGIIRDGELGQHRRNGLADAPGIGTEVEQGESQTLTDLEEPVCPVPDLLGQARADFLQRSRGAAIGASSHPGRAAPPYQAG